MVFVQPFAIDFRYETEHVIAFCSGHPEYEAVEAFIARRSNRGPRIRAILTRHDMSQVDHINEGEVVRERRAIDPTRETYHAPIAFEQTTAGALRDSVLRFSSYKGETIVLELVAAFPADPAFGGLTDPQGHAPDVLPVMWRSASAVAARATRVTIDDVPYPIPVFVETADLVGMKAFYTRGFAVGIVRTRGVELDLVAAPAEMTVGQRWSYRQGDRRVDYEIAEREGDRVVIRRTPGKSETIHAHVSDDGLRIGRITLASGSETSSTLSVDFDPFLPAPARRASGVDPISTFCIGIDDHTSLVTGSVMPVETGFELVPVEPVWARSRAINLRLTQDGNTLRLRSSISGAGSAGGIASCIHGTRRPRNA